MDHPEYIGFQGNKRTGYSLIISDGYETYGGVPEPVTRLIRVSDLQRDNITVTGSGKARFKRLPQDFPHEQVGSVQAKIRNGAAELKRRSLKATFGSLAIAGGARVIGDLLVPGSGESASVLVEKAIKACEWTAQNAGDASLWCSGATGVGFATEHATRVVRVYNFELNISISDNPVSLACAMPTHHFRQMLQEINKTGGDE